MIDKTHVLLGLGIDRIGLGIGRIGDILDQGKYAVNAAIRSDKNPPQDTKSVLPFYVTPNAQDDGPEKREFFENQRVNVVLLYMSAEKTSEGIRTEADGIVQYLSGENIPITEMVIKTVVSTTQIVPAAELETLIKPKVGEE